MVLIPAKDITLEEFLKLPETKPASEYINGQIIKKPMPQGKHSILRGELLTAINAVVEPQRIALAFPKLRCSFGGCSVVPDVSVFAWERIPEVGRGLGKLDRFVLKFISAELTTIVKTVLQWLIILQK